MYRVTKFFLSYNANDDKVVINYTGTTGNFVHESTHAGQYETRDIGLNPAGGTNNYGVDLQDEVAAYQAQYAFSPSSVSGLQSSSSVSSMSDVTSSWGIYNPATGQYPYQAQHIGLILVNTTSPVSTLQQAYPSLNFGGYSPNAPLNTIVNLKQSPLCLRNAMLAN